MRTEARKGGGFKDSLRRMILRYTFVPILLLFVLFLVFMIVNARLELINQTRDAGRYVKAGLEKAFDQYANELDRAASEEAVIRFVEGKAGAAPVYEQFYDFLHRQNVKSIMHLTTMDGTELTSSANYGTDQSRYALQAIVNRMNTTGKLVLMETNHIRYAEDRYTAYTFAKQLRGENGPIGYLIFQLFEEDLQRLIFVQKNEIAAVVDDFDTVIVTTNPLTRGLMDKYHLTIPPNGKGFIYINGERYYSMETKMLPLLKWRIYTLSAGEWTTRMYVSLAVFFVLTSMILWILVQYLARIIAFRQTRSIDKLIFAVQKLQAGEMDAYVYIGTGDEFEALANQYNIMLTRLNALMAKNEELSHLRRVIETKHLQSQFHPHFIFNVLEMLRYAIVVDHKLAQEIVLTLSRHLRYSISNEGQLVVLEEDLHHVNDYMQLQQMRFKNRLDYHADMDAGAQHAYVPRLIIQPVIENAIKYGYKQKEKLAIRVRAYTSHNDLVLEVADNGGGMSEDRLNEVRAIMYAQHNEAEHIGLHNLHRRLELMYGEGYGIQIQSQLGEGAIIIITIPLRRGEPDV
ncbi:sensor histidine kinase [Paenibacillus sp. GCM10012307]